MIGKLKVLVFVYMHVCKPDPHPNLNFYYFAKGSVTETQSHLEYGKRVGYFDKDLVEKLGRQLLKLYNDLNKIVVTLKNFKK